MSENGIGQGAFAWRSSDEAPLERPTAGQPRPEAPPGSGGGGARGAPPSLNEGATEARTFKGDRLGPPLMRADEVAAHLRCSVEMVYKLRRMGRLRAVRLGALYRWKPEVVRAFLEAAEGR